MAPKRTVLIGTALLVLGPVALTWPLWPSQVGVVKGKVVEAWAKPGGGGTNGRISYQVDGKTYSGLMTFAGADVYGGDDVLVEYNHKFPHMPRLRRLSRLTWALMIMIPALCLIAAGVYVLVSERVRGQKRDARAVHDVFDQPLSQPFARS